MAADQMQRVTRNMVAMMRTVAVTHTQMAIQAESMVDVLNGAADASAAGFTDEGRAMLGELRASIGPAAEAMRRHIEALDVMQRLYARLLMKGNSHGV